MPILVLAEVLFQAFCIRHAMMNQKQDWIYIILLVPARIPVRESGPYANLPGGGFVPVQKYFSASGTPDRQV